MNATKAKVLNGAVKYWIAEYRKCREARYKFGMERAWNNACDSAERAPGYLLLGGKYINRITRVGPRGTLYGREIYKTRKDGAERSMGKASI
jgi:hypothetical protein